MEKNLEKSLKRLLKRKVKITMGLVVSFLITGMVSFAEGNTKGADKKAEVKNINGEEYIINEEILKNILSRISVGNIHIIGETETSGKQEINGGFGINNGTLTGGGMWGDWAQEINGGLGINNGSISNGGDYGQEIENGLGINNGIISSGGSFIQNINSNGLGINNGTISKGGNYGQYLQGGLGINNGIISNGGDYGQKTFTGGLAINNGIISNGGDYGQYLQGGLGINNGIIINKKAYGGGAFYKNGISLKRDGDKLVLNNDNGYNDNINTLGKNELTSNKLSEVITNNKIEQKNVGQEIINGQAQDIKGYNLFINNLGNETNGNGTDNQLVIDTDLTENFANTHITTAVTENGYKLNEAVIKIADGLDNFSMDKSTIVGYFEKNGTLVNMNGAKTVELNDSIISVFTGSDKTGFTGTAPTDVNAIEFAEGSIVTLNNSTVNGKMDFSNGNNTLNLNGKYNGTNHDTYKDGTQYGTYVSDVEFGAGNDKIEIKFTETKDGNEVTDYSSSYDKTGLINLGKVNFGDGEDTLSFSFDEMKKGNFVLAGDIDFGAGDDTVALKSKITAKNEWNVLDDEKGKENIVLLNNLLFNKIKDGTLETIQLADGENEFYFNTRDNSLSLNFTGKIIGGNSDDIFLISSENLQKVFINGGGHSNFDILELTTAVDNTQDTNNSKFKNVENIRVLRLSNTDGNKIDINKLEKSDGTLQFGAIIGGNKDDYFKSSLENIGLDDFVGGAGDDTLELTDVITETTDDSSLGKLLSSSIDILQLANGKNNVVVDRLSTYLGFGWSGGKIIGGNQDDILVATKESISALDGGAGIDTLKVTNGIYGDLQQGLINSVQNIENLELSDNGNIITIDNISKDFISIKGGTGTDTFVSTLSGLNGKTLTGGAGQDSLELQEDKFDNTTNNPFTSVTEIENLKLADVTGNIVDIDKLTDFTTINGGNQGDSFTIGDSSKLGITINGGTGNDSLVLNTSVDTSKDLKNISSIENLTFNAEKNKLSFADTDKNNFASLSFGKDSTGNAVALNNLNEKEITFENSKENTVTIADSSNKFNHKITGAEKIELSQGNSKWTFDKGSLITGNTELNLNGNNLDFTDSQGKGNVGLVGTDLKINDVSFVGTDSRVTISNGTIKIGFDDSVKFKDGINTEFKLSSDGKIGFGDKLSFETYSFINIGNDLKVTVKKWDDYFTDKSDDRLVYAGRYDEALKKYNTSGNEALTEAFNIFGEKTVVDYIVNNANPKLLYYSDKGSYEVLVAEKGEDILIKSSDTEADKNTKLTFNNISSTGKITIGVTEGNNEVTFGSGKDSSVSIKGENGIDFSSSTADLTVNIAGEKTNEVSKIVGNDRDNIINLSGNQISIDKIALGTGENTIKISDISNITKLGSITAESQDKNSLEIVNGIEKSESGKLISLLNSDIKGISKVELGDGNDISVNSKYSYSGKVNLNSNNEVDVLNGGVLKSLNFAGDNNTVTLNGGSAEGDLTFAGNNNQTVLNSGTLTGTLDFGKGTGNIFTVNTGNEFNYKVSNADIIQLNKTDKEWTFGNGAKISGDTKINLNGNTALLSTTSNGTTVTLNRDFAEGNVTFSNGTIKITLNQNTDFSNGVNTKLTLADGGLTGDAKLQTYAFLNADSTDKTISVIDWKTLSGDEEIKDNHIITYNNTIKRFNEDGIYGVLTVWEKDSIVSWIKKNGEVLEDHTVESNKGDYSGIVSSGTITIDTDKGGKLEDLDIKDLSSKDVVIENNTTEGDGKVDFTGSTAVLGTVTNNSKEDVEISFGGNTNVGTIDSSKSEGKTDINITIDKDKDKFVSGDIIFNDKDGNRLDITDSSKVENIGKIEGNVDITIDKVGENSDGFNDILAGANSGLNGNKDNNSITVNGNADVNITNKYDGKLEFKGEENNITVGNSIGTLVTGNGKDTVTLEGNVGSLNTGSNDDIINLNISKFADKVIKVNLDGGEGEDIFNIISLKSEKSANEKSDKQPEKYLTGKINSLETINVNTNVGFASDLEITGTKEIKLNGNKLFVSVDYSKVSDDNKVIGHALYDNGIKVDNSTGKVMIDTAKSDNGTIISLGKDNKTEFTNQENILESGSSNHHIEFVDGDIVVKINDHIMGDSETGGAIKYAHLDKIYQSIVSADKIKEMSETTTLLNKTKDEAVKAQLEFYGKIYHSTPYAYSNDVSKKSADLITESIMNLKVMPEYKHWVFGGSIAGQEADSDYNFYGSNHYNGIDIGKNEISADTNIYVAYAFGKYGVGQNQSVGFALAGTRSDTDISGNSKLEGDAVYISAFAEQEINNLKLTAGISYQHSFYDSTRNVSNDYQRMSVDKKYEDDLISVFAGGKYSYHLGNNFFAEPKVKLSVTYVMQNSIDEGDNGKLTIETDKKDFTFVEGEVGIDLVKKVNLSKGTLNLRAGTSLVYSIEGYEEEYLTGRITGSSKDFEMISPEDDRTRVKFTVGTEYEMTNGMFMNLHGNYTTSSHAEDYAVSFGAGYRF